MSVDSHAARLRIMNTPADEPSPRAQALLARIKRLGISDMSEREAEKILKVSRTTLGRLEDGLTVYSSSLSKMERGLDDYVAELGLEEIDERPASATAPQEPELFQLTVSIGALDLKVTASGRPQDADLVREQVQRAVADLIRETKD